MLDQLKYHDFRSYFGSASLVGNDIPAKLRLGEILRDLSDREGRTAILKRAVAVAGSHAHVNDDTAQKNLMRGAGNAELAWAFYDRLHVEMPHIEALLDIDRELLNGRTFRDVAGRAIVMEAADEADLPSTGFPELYLDTVVPGISNWLSPFNEQSLPFFGRAAEKQSLDEFAAKNDAFSVWALVGPSGSGKTRLTANWLRTSEVLRGWRKGFFLEPSNEEWPRWRPERPTFIVIDDLFAHGEVIAAIVERCLTLTRMGILRHRVRLLIIDRIFPADVDNLATDNRWNAVFRRTIDMDARTSILHRSSPLSLIEADDQAQVLQSILRSASGIADTSDYRVVAALEQLYQMDSAGRPLFAALIGRTLSATDGAKRWTRKDLIRYYLSGADHLPWPNDEIDGDLVGCFVAAATVLRGISFERLISVLPSAVSESSGRVARIRANAARIVGNYEHDGLQAFQPDILGETFFLLLLERLENSPPTMNLLKRMCAVTVDAESERDTAFVSFFQGLIANLIAEGADETSVKRAWSLIIKFLEIDDNDAGTNAIVKTVATISIHNILFQNEIKYINSFRSLDASLFAKFDGGSFKWSFLNVMLEWINWTLSSNDIPAETRSELVDFANYFSLSGEDMPHLLGVCAGNGHLALVEALLERGSDPNEERLGGATALLVASEFGHADVVSLLIHHGADPDHGNKTDGSTALMWACEAGHIDVVKALLEEGADPNKTRFGDGGVAVQLAAAHGHVDVVEHLVAKGADINHRKADGLTALAMACARGDKAVVRALLRLRSDPNRGDEAGDLTPLGLACRSGHLAIAKLLVRAGARAEGQSKQDQPIIAAAIGGHLPVIKYLHSRGVRLDAENENGVNALFITSAQGHVGCLKYLIENSANIDPPARQSGVVMTALAAALSAGQIDTANLLINSGANPNAGYEPGSATPLGYAAAFGHLDLAKRLLDADANFEAIGIDGWTPMTAACSGGHYEIAALLIARGAAADLNDGAARCPLMCAASDGSQELVRMLLRNGCDPNVISRESGSSALGYACANDNVDAVRLLLDAGADPLSAAWKESFGPFHTAAGEGSVGVVRFFLANGRLPDDVCQTTGMAALTVASMEGHIDIVDELIARNAKVDITSQQQDSTPLMWAAQGGHSRVVSRLLKAGAAPDKQRNSDGKSALHVAASHGRADVVELLIKNKANPNVQCGAGVTPLMTAVAAGHDEVARLLLRNGADPGIKDRRGHTARGYALIGADKEIHRILILGGAPSLNYKECILYLKAYLVGMYSIIFRQRQLLSANGEALLEAAKRGSLNQVRRITSAFDTKDYQNQHGETALMVAVAKGHKGIVDHLIECDADLRKLDLAGNSAVTLARSTNQDAILEALLMAGAEDQFQSR